MAQQLHQLGLLTRQERARVCHVKCRTASQMLVNQVVARAACSAIGLTDLGLDWYSPCRSSNETNKPDQLYIALCFLLDLFVEKYQMLRKCALRTCWDWLLCSDLTTPLSAAIQRAVAHPAVRRPSTSSLACVSSSSRCLRRPVSC